MRRKLGKANQKWVEDLSTVVDLEFENFRSAMSLPVKRQEECVTCGKRFKSKIHGVHFCAECEDEGNLEYFAKAG